MAAAAQQKNSPVRGSVWFAGLRRTIRSGRKLGPRFMIGLAIILFLVSFGVLGPIITQRNEPMRIVGGLYDPPSVEAWLGTDNFGRDVFTQLMHGTRTSLLIGLISGTVATLIGVLVGTMAGYMGGVVEEILMALTNVVITIPSIVILILLSIAFSSRTIPAMGIIIGVTAWPWTARAVRAQTSSLRTREHVDVARLSGASTLGLIFWEIIPYMLSYIVLAFILQLNTGILQEATLSMLGLGVDKGISLGIMLQWALLWEAVRKAEWWAFIPPTLFLTLIAFSLLLLQSSIDQIFNPRLRRS